MTSALTATVYAPPISEDGWRLEEFFSDRDVRYFGFARCALASGLRSLGLKAGDAVLAPEYVCRDLLSGIAAVGARVEFYAQAADLSPARKPTDWPAAKAVIAVDYFGFPQDLTPFEEYARLHQAAVIEDAAHALLSRDPQGQPLGGRADLGLLSIRKTIPLPNGAALLAKRGRVTLEAQHPYDAVDSTRYLGRQAYRVFARNLGSRAALGGLNLLRRTRRLVAGRAFPGSPDDAERVLPEQNRPCGQLAEPLRGVSPAAERDRRRALYRLLEDRLASCGIAPVFKSLPEGTVPYGYPYRADAAAAERAEEFLAELGLFSLGWPDLPDAVAPRAPAHYKNVRLAHFLW